MYALCIKENLHHFSNLNHFFANVNTFDTLNLRFLKIPMNKLTYCVVYYRCRKGLTFYIGFRP